MNILVIDAQGGGLGKQLVLAIKREIKDATVTAVGTNCLATSAMMKAGADFSATGENSIVVCSRDADVIAGPIGIVIADSLLGEITKKMAVAVGSSKAKRVLIPINHCNNIIAGVSNLTLKNLIDSAIEEIKKIK